ncbi:ABC transporter substrate-binding protein [Streptantibioticus ferralitis]|uniref:ABC transporter substrate-binding protein n=1 Tax=Streptantibioticus ferralitis TaxID=236510 RepID=A0ABT5YYW2_9ACTN|nr:ABC transporter substrate-binding protein [Streptantibioticus ferralitis]MDF2256782.1 ABC transporter substrate-binding protein [Streptantibioticus ferralitis]
MRWSMVARWVVTGVLLLSGCGSPASSAVSTGADGTGPVTLATGRDLTGYLRGRLQVWNASHPTQKATLIELPEAADDVRAQMISNLQAKSERYDVLNMDVSWTAEFAAAGWISPLDTHQFPLDKFLKPVVDTATFRDRLYAVPYVTNAGVLYYRKDILDREHLPPPRTWADLERDARTVAPRYGLKGYAGQFLPYEGLTVNYAEAVQSAGGQLLSGEGTKVAVDSPAARQALDFLVRGVREGWIPQEALTFKEEESRQAFQDGRYLFMRNWPYAYDLGEAKGSPIAGRFGVVPLPGLDGPGSSSLGGSNLAVSSYSRHQKTARALIRFLTGLDNERQVLLQGSLPPVWAQLYTDPALVRRYPYLPVLRQSILSAKPRPKTPDYDQVSLAVAEAAHDALTLRRSPDEATARLADELGTIVRGP